MHLGSLWTDTGHHVLDDMVLSGRIHALKDEQEGIPVMGVQQFLQLFQAAETALQMLRRRIFVGEWSGIGRRASPQHMTIAGPDTKMVNTHDSLPFCRRSLLVRRQAASANRESPAYPGRTGGCTARARPDAR